MARFLPEYREVDTRSTAEKIAFTLTCIGIFLLIPGTALGYVAEKSYPGQVLYPMKRGIEQMVLAVESITPYSRSSYLQTLAKTRIQETNDLIANIAPDNTQTQLYNDSLNSVVFFVTEAQTSIQQIKDPVAKQQATQQLATSIQSYQVQLHQIDYTLQSHLLSAPTVPTTVPTTALGQPTRPVQPSPTPVQQSSLQSLDTQINSVVQQLSAIDNSLPTTITPPPPTPSPTLLPTSTPTPTIILHRDGNHRNGVHD